MKKTILFTMMTVSANILMAQLTPAQMQSIKEQNPLVQEWNTPYQTPPFNKIKTTDFKPAIQYSLEKAKEDINAIISNTEEPTFPNTIEALDRSGRLFSRTLGVFYNLNEANTSKEMQAIAEQMAPELTAYSNDLNMNPLLFARVKAVYDKRDDIPLTTEQKTLLEKTYRSFVDNGALLQGKDKEEYRKITEELALLTLKFQKNDLEDQNAYQLLITNKNELKGMPQYAIDAAKDAAKEKGKKGWLFTLDAPSFIPFLTYNDNRELREQMWKAYNTQGNLDNANNNKEVARDIANHRLRLAQLLGYKSYAQYALSDKMAETPEKVNAFLEELKEASLPFAKKDLKEVTDYAHSKGFNGDLQRWDFGYWSEKLKQERYSISPEETKPYFQLENVKKGIFMLADTLYGLQFKENNTIQKYHPDVTVYEVWDKNSGKFMAVLYMDFFPRASKRSGAWMTNFREQYVDEKGNDVRPLVQLVTNFTKPTSKTPSLLTFDEFNTLLHEFGHCLHGILTECHYSSLSGTNVYHDFVEMPSQIMENFATEKQFLDMFAKDYKTGEKIPQSLIEKIKKSEQYNAGWLSLRQLFFGLLDMHYHNISKPLTGDIEASEREISSVAELLPPVKGCIMTTQFGHIFSSGYAAGYYGYKWAEVIDADAFSVFQAKGIFNKEVSTSLRRNILSQGGKKHPMELYKAFRGGEPTNEALLRRCGFIK